MMLPSVALTHAAAEHLRSTLHLDASAAAVAEALVQRLAAAGCNPISDIEQLLVRPAAARGAAAAAAAAGSNASQEVVALDQPGLSARATASGFAASSSAASDSSAPPSVQYASANVTIVHLSASPPHLVPTIVAFG